MPFILTILLVSGVLSSLLVPSEWRIEPHEIPPVQAHIPRYAEVAGVATESLEEIVERVSRETDFDPQIVRNVIDIETGGTRNCDLVGKQGELGCFQIKPWLHSVESLNFEDSVRYFIKEYKAGREYQWTGCSCVAGLRVFSGYKFPKVDATDFPVNSPVSKGAIAVFDYDGVRHVALVTSLNKETFSVKEANYKPCAFSDREVLYNDTHLVGFMAPSPAMLGLENTATENAAPTVRN